MLFFQITPSLAKVLLHTHGWTVQELISKYRSDASLLLVQSRIKPPHPPPRSASSSAHGSQSSLSSKDSLEEDESQTHCLVCVTVSSSEVFSSLACGHKFCKDCWTMHFEVQIIQGISTGKPKFIQSTLSTVWKILS